MQTVYSRRFSFLGSSAAFRAVAGLASITLLAGCSSGPSAPAALAPVPSGSMAARDAAADITNPGVLSMAAGDRLGMAVYARNIELARADLRERTRMAARQPASRTVVASADE
ncbi:MAG: hypothetical protein KF805_04660 [Phycisphaeraceae bacterium]|nr:hypothetical protein [Phycisphaeraceae bacterium]